MLVRLMDLPPRIKGFVVRRNGEDVIVLNSRLNREQNMKTYLHEKKHIENGDFEKLNVDEIERDAHNE
jgi:hypothetical protein